MRSPRAWAYLTSLLVVPLVGACPPTPDAQETESGASTDGQTSDTTVEVTTGECPIGGLGCPCTQGGACNAGLVCAPDQRCVDDDDSTGTGTPTATSTTGSTTDELTSTTNESSTTVTPGMCNVDDGNQPNFDCLAIDPLQPYCADTNVCGGCTVLPPDNGCAVVAPGKPICNQEDGQCVSCTADDASQCGGETPACNPATNACEGCFEHSHCPGTACDILARTCFPLDQVLHVRHGTLETKDCTIDVPSGGSSQNPFCSANLALERAQIDGPSSGWTIKFLETSIFEYAHDQITANSVPADSPVSYAFVHEGELSQEEAYYKEHTQLRSSQPVLTVGANVTAYVNNFALFSTGQSDVSTGVTCLPGGTVFLDDSVVRDARGPGIRAVGCDVYLRRSSVTLGKTEGIELDCAERHCELHMVNSYISDNKYFQTMGGGGIRAENATLDIVYSTILGNNNEFDANDPMARGDSIHCVGDQVDGTVRNSVIGRKQMGNVRSINCDPDMLAVTNSLLDSEVFKTGNQKQDSEAIMGSFNANGLTGARPIKSTGELFGLMDDVAIWEKGDPPADYDGHARVAKDLQNDYVGADVYTKN